MPDQDQTTTPLDVLAQLTVTVETLADFLVLTPTRVQQLAKKGIVDKDGHGVYRLLASIQGYIREINAKADGKNSEWHRARTRLMQLNLKDAQRKYAMEMGQLVRDAAYQRAREEKDAKIKQRLLAFEKVLPQKLGGLTAEAQVPIIRNEIRKILNELATTERPLGRDNGGGPDIPASAGSDGVSVGGREAETQQ